MSSDDTILTVVSPKDLETICMDTVKALSELEDISSVTFEEII